jgi:ADP-heptose:LPS heptosyltransferase
MAMNNQVPLVLKCFLSPGDIVMMTAAVRDLHRAYPGRFLTDVRTSVPELWENNPFICQLNETEGGTRVIDMHCPLIHQSNQRPFHFIHAFAQYLEQQLGLPVPVTEFKGDIHVSPKEKSWISQVEETGFKGNFWIIIAGGKYDYTAKWWNPDCFQQVVNHFKNRILFVQCGADNHFHPRLNGVLDFVGRTSTRQFIRLVHHADGILCPVTFAMHLAAAVETKQNRPRNRACVVVAGGREPPHWEAYPNHRFLSTNGALPCCDNGGCWKSRCQMVDDGRDNEQSVCQYPVPVSPQLRIPKCMAMITAADVIRAIEMYYEGGSLRYNSDSDVNATSSPIILDSTKEQIKMNENEGSGETPQFQV